MAVVEMAVNEDRITPSVAGQFAMTMLTTTAKGDAYSRNEIEPMCRVPGRDSSYCAGHLANGDCGGELSLPTQAGLHTI
jgi:hypothetical protein